ETVSGRVNVLVGSHLTPADVETLRGWFLSFGLSPVILPDLSVLDGSRQVFSPLALGGTTLESIRGMGRAEITLVIGPSLVQAAEVLQKGCGVPFKVFHTLSGVEGATRFFAFLQKFSGRPLPADLDRARRVLIDGMGDAQTVFGGKRIAVAQEGDLALQTASWLREMNVAYLLAVLPTSASAVKDIPADEVVVGDLASVPTGCHLLISNSHGVEVAKRLRTAHYPLGFPVFETLGTNNRVTIGFGGTLNLVHSVGNRLMGGES
ncbi:MAG: nitrogenase component 1, partial [bacterium]|nr:nitrogenase component 1 [bacterium]